MKLGSILGVPVFLTPSWLLVAAFITLSYADFFHERVRDTSSLASYSLALLFSIALGISVLAHELGHSIASRMLGLRVRRIVVFLLGGVSEIESETTRPRDEFVIAAAGPGVSFLLAGGCWVASQLPASDSAVGVTCVLLAWSNLVVAVFNVLPGLPLDGGRILQSLVWMATGSRLTGVRFAAWSGRVVAVLTCLAVGLGNAILTRDDGSDSAAIFAAVLGFAVAAFLWTGASQTLHSAQLAQRATDLDIKRFIRPAIYLPPDTPISEAVRHAIERGAGSVVVVDAMGRSRAIVRESEVMGLDPARQPWSTVGDVSRPLESGMLIKDTMSGDQVLAALRAYPASEYLVIGDDGVSRGVIATADLARALGLPSPAGSH